MAQGPDFSVMDHLVKSKALRHPIFSVFLSDSDMEASEITFGDVKEEHMSSSMFWSSSREILDIGRCRLRISRSTMRSKASATTARWLLTLVLLSWQARPM
jgi:hypothetical protein